MRQYHCCCTETDSREIFWRRRRKQLANSQRSSEVRKNFENTAVVFSNEFWIKTNEHIPLLANIQIVILALADLILTEYLINDINTLSKFQIKKLANSQTVNKK